MTERRELCDFCKQRLSFAYGNTAIENSHVTKQMVENAIREGPCPTNTCRIIQEDQADS